MNINKTRSKSWANYGINIKIRLAALWTSLMFLYIYADYFQLMTPHKLEKMMNLETPVGPTSPEILIVFSIILIIPALMIFLSVFLNSRINRWLNIIIGLIYMGISIIIIISTFGDNWHAFYLLFNLVEALIFSIITVQAWKWPREE